MNSEQNKKDRDKDKILHTLQDMFIDVLDLDVIQNVAHNCNFDLHDSIEALMMLAEGAPQKSPSTAQVTENRRHSMAEDATSAHVSPTHAPELPLRPLDEKPTQETVQAKDPPNAPILNQQSREKVVKDPLTAPIRNQQSREKVVKDPPAAPILSQQSRQKVTKDPLTAPTRNQQSPVESCSSPGSIKVSYRGQNGCSSSDDDADVFIEDEQECEVLNPTAEGAHTFSMFGSPFSPQFVTPVLPAKLPSKPLFQMQQKPFMKVIKPPNIPPPIPSMATAASKLKDIKMQPTVPKARKNAEHVQSTQLKIMQQLSPIERLQKMVLDGVCLMIIMRGAPGSGKSFLARHLVLTTLGRNVDFSRYVFSTDDFFALMNNQFNPAFLQHAHEWNRRRVQQAVARKVSPIIIDNTNTQVWEMQPYAEMAVRSGYVLELLEPNTAWRYHEAELFKRNLHGVPRPQIRAMLDRFEHNLTGKKLIDTLGLKYSSNNKPNVMGKNAGKSAKPKSAKLPHINEEQNASSALPGKTKKIRTRRRKKKIQASNAQKTNGIPYIGGEQIRLYAEAYANLSKKSEPGDLGSSKDPVATSLNMSNQKNPVSKDDMAKDNRHSVSSETGLAGLCLNTDGQSLTDGSSNSEYDEEEDEEEKESFSTSLEANKLQTEEFDSQLDELFYSDDDDDRKAKETKERNTEYNPCTDYMLVLSDSSLLPQKHFEILEEKEECWEYVLVLPDSVHVPQKLHAADVSHELNKTEATTAAEIQTQNDHPAADTNTEITADTALIDLTDTPEEKDETLQTQMPLFQFVAESSTPVCSPSLIDTPLTISDKEGLGPVCELSNELSATVMPLSPSSDCPNIQLELDQNNKDTELQEVKSSCAADMTSISIQSVSSGDLDHWLGSVDEKYPEGSPEQELHHTSQSEESYTAAEPTASNLLAATHDSNDEEFLSALSSNDSLTEDKVNQLPDNFNDNLLIKFRPEEALMETEENSLAAEAKNENLSKPGREAGASPLINDLFPVIALKEIPKYDFFTLVKECETKEDSEEQIKNINEQKIVENSDETTFKDLNVSIRNTKPEFSCTEQLHYTYKKNAKDDELQLNIQVIPEYQEQVKVNTYNQEQSTVNTYNQEQSTTVYEEESLNSDKMTHCLEENSCMEVATSVDNYKPVNAEVCLPKQENKPVEEHLSSELLVKTNDTVQQIENETIRPCLKEEMLGKTSDDSEKTILLHVENEHQAILKRTKSFERDDESVTSSLRHDELSNPIEVTKERHRLHKDSTEKENEKDQLHNWEKIGDGWQDQEVVEPKTCVENAADLPKPARERRSLRKADSPYRVLITQIIQEPKLEQLPISPEMEAWSAVPEPVQSWESSEKSSVLESTKDNRADLPQPQREIFASEVVLEDTLVKELNKKNERESRQTPTAVGPDSLKHKSDSTSVEDDNLPILFNKLSTSKENDLEPDVRNSEHFEKVETCSMQLGSFSVEKRDIIREHSFSSHSEEQQSKYVNESAYLFPISDLSSWKSESYKTEITRTDMAIGKSLQLNLESEESKSNEIKKMEEELILNIDRHEKAQLASEKGSIEDNFAIQSSTLIPMTNFDANTVETSTSVPRTNFDADTIQISTSVPRTNFDADTVKTSTSLPRTNFYADTVQISTSVPRTNFDADTVETFTSVPRTNFDEDTVQTSTSVPTTNFDADTVQSSTSVPTTNFDADTVQSSRSAPTTNFDANTVETSTSVLTTNFDADTVQSSTSVPRTNFDADTVQISTTFPITHFDSYAIQSLANLDTDIVHSSRSTPMTNFDAIQSSTSVPMANFDTDTVQSSRSTPMTNFNAIQSSTSVPMANFDTDTVQSSRSTPGTNFVADTIHSSSSAPVINFDSDTHAVSSSLWKLEAYCGLPKEDVDYDIDSASEFVPKHGMTSASTNTLREDFMILEQVERLGSPAGPMRDISVLHARSRSIDEGLNIASEDTHLSIQPHSAQGVRTYDKSSMTSEEDRDFAAAMLASAHEREVNFNQLVAIFPAVDKDDLLEIFDRCNGDLNWAADILLESGLEHFEGAASNSPPTHDRESDESAGVAERDFTSEQGAAGGLLWWENVPTEMASSLVCQESEASSLRDYGPDFNLSPHQSQSPSGRISSSKGSPSEASQQLKKQLEERVVLNEHCYSERTRRIWNLRHGQRDVEERVGPSEITDEAAAIVNLNTVQQPLDEKPKLQINEPDSPGRREPLDKVSDVEAEYIEEEEEEEELVPFTIDGEFASQLQQLFGNAAAVPYDEDASLDVKLPLSLARQIHSYLVETQQSLMEHQYKEMQKMIREDEELARRLQEEEHETKNSVPDLRVVMDMEMALELYRSDQEQWKNGQGKDDLATKLSKQKLCQMFPNLDQDALLQLFTAHSNSFEDTVNEVVVSVDGLRDTEAVRNVLAPEALAAVERSLIEQARQESLKIAENQTRPLPIVVLREPGELKSRDPQQQAKADAEHYRVEANRHRQLRSECINKAQEAYRSGMKTVATYYSQMASLHRQRIDEANARAASSLVTVHTLSQDSTTLDLHFLHVVEALQVLDLFLDHRIVNLASTNRALEYLFLITGRGLRSAGGRSRIRPAVEMRLKQRGVKWSIVNPGMLKVLITRNSVLAYSSVSTTL